MKRKPPRREKLTKTVVNNAEPENERYPIWDTLVSGFGLVVQPSGHKSYIFKYRNMYGIERKLTIGGLELTPDQARRIATGYALSVRQGIDPQGEKKEKPKDLTINEVLDEYFDSATFEKKKAATQRNDKGRALRHLRPTLGEKRISELTKDGIQAAMAKIESGATACTVKTGPRGLARVTGGAGAARMSARLLKAALNWASNEGKIKSNPAAGFKVPKDGQREVELAQTDYPKVYKALNELVATQMIDSGAADAIRIVMMTGSRGGEIRHLKWCEVDLDNGLLEIVNHKTAEKTGGNREIGLPPKAVEIIKNRWQAKTSSNDFVFGRAHPLTKIWPKVREKAGLGVDVVLHSFRHRYAHKMVSEGATAAQIMDALGHRKMETSQTYIDSNKNKKRKVDIARRFGTGLDEGLDG